MATTRRKFLKHSLCAGLGASSAAGMLGNLAMTAGAMSPTVLQSGDYKALVCVFLFGGNDGDNTVVPYSQSDYDVYARTRGNLALPRTSLLPITPATRDGRDFAFHASFTEMQSLFQQKKLAIIANTGPLIVPTTRTQFLQESVPLPPQLFSHNDQQVHWMTSRPDEAPKSGWGGRLADAMNALSPNAQISMSISISGTNLFQVGTEVFPYMVSSEGTIKLWYYNDAWNYAGTNLTKSALEQNYNNVFEKTYRDTFKRSIDNEKKLSAALSKAPMMTTVFPANNDLAKQLKMVAKLMSVRNELGLRRQIFYCTHDGFDTHNEQINAQAGLLRETSLALDAFYKATVELGIASNVTTFTTSDFGRTYRSNGRGSDHGWGNHQFVLGDAVRGGDLYGKIPVHRVEGPDDSGDGRWIPTIATDEYFATLAQWFGVSGTDLAEVLPNINRFGRTNLGFLT